LNVFWTRGTRMVGGKMQLGVAVLRPGWFAFLPLFDPMGAGGQFGMGMTGAFAGAGFGMDSMWQTKYPIHAWWSAGERAFDDFIARAAQEQRGIVLSRSDGEVVRATRIVVQAANDPTIAVAFLQAPPPHFLEGWPKGVAHFDARKTAAAFAVMSALLVLFAGGCGATAVIRDEPLGHIGTLFWFALAVAPWVAFFVRRASYRREMAAKAATRGPLPYR
jgi:hypothetical protein